MIWQFCKHVSIVVCSIRFLWARRRHKLYWAFISISWREREAGNMCCWSHQQTCCFDGSKGTSWGFRQKIWYGDSWYADTGAAAVKNNIFLSTGSQSLNSNLLATAFDKSKETNIEKVSPFPFSPSTPLTGSKPGSSSRLVPTKHTENVQLTLVILSSDALIGYLFYCYCS